MDKETVNDRAKLMMHRLIARRLAREPTLLADAKAAVRLLAIEYPDSSFPEEWSTILDLPQSAIRQKLTSRVEDMQRLRLSSPFVTSDHAAFLRNPDLRRRIWQLARMGLARKGAVERDMPHAA